MASVLAARLVSGSLAGRGQSLVIVECECVGLYVAYTRAVNCSMGAETLSSSSLILVVVLGELSTRARFGALQLMPTTGHIRTRPCSIEDEDENEGRGGKECRRDWPGPGERLLPRQNENCTVGQLCNSHSVCLLREALGGGFTLGRTSRTLDVRRTRPPAPGSGPSPHDDGEVPLHNGFTFRIRLRILVA